MMAAAADYAEGAGNRPRILTLALDCEAYRALPRSGGVLDQPAGLLKKMRTVLNVYRAFKVYNSEGQRAGMMAKWRRQNADAWNLISEVNRLRNGRRDAQNRN